jgi:hypothetical protein
MRRVGGRHLVGALSCLVSLSLSGLSTAIAQQAPEQTTLTVVIVTKRDTVTAPVPEALVEAELGSQRFSARSAENGRVRFVFDGNGIAKHTVRRVGAEPSKLVARIAPGANEITVRIDERTTVLEPVRVIGGCNVSARLGDFENRLAERAANAAVTSDDIARLRPIALSQMIRRMPGVRVSDSDGSTVLISQRGLKYERGRMVDCVLRVVVDGIVIPSSNVDAIPPADVHGVELFLGPARIPLQLGGLRRDQICGMVAIWTKGG